MIKFVIIPVLIAAILVLPRVTSDDDDDAARKRMAYQFGRSRREVLLREPRPVMAPQERELLQLDALIQRKRDILAMRRQREMEKSATEGLWK